MTVASEPRDASCVNEHQPPRLASLGMFSRLRPCGSGEDTNPANEGALDGLKACVKQYKLPRGTFGDAFNPFPSGPLCWSILVPLRPRACLSFSYPLLCIPPTILPIMQTFSRLAVIAGALTVASAQFLPQSCYSLTAQCNYVDADLSDVWGNVACTQYALCAQNYKTPVEIIGLLGASANQPKLSQDVFANITG
ncbi:hypothetical protein CONPUDRAFT_164655, partial [Coniophora puteana RWD-64-598 SS2]